MAPTHPGAPMTLSSLLALCLSQSIAAERDLLRGDDVTWRTVHDTVMGGRSSGGYTQTEGRVRFEGTLSLDNNGGFASLRARSDSFALANTEGIELQVVGDGRSWWVTADRADVPLRAGSYRAELQTRAGETTTHTLRWSDFTPTSFGRPVAGVPPLQHAPERIVQLGWMIADGQPGDFQLEVRSVRPLPVETTPPTSERSGPSNRDRVAMAFAAAIRLGVPAFNQGDAGRCRAHYHSAIESVLILHPNGLSDAEHQALQRALAESSLQSDHEAAWTLRRAMDRILASAVSVGPGL